MGNFLFLCTDGLTEVFNVKKEILGIARFTDIIKNYAERNVELV